MDYRLRHTATAVRGAGVLRLSPAEDRGAKTVVVLHGLGGAKEMTLPLMYALASSGFEAVALDLFLHGERPDSPALQGLIDRDLAATVFKIIYETAIDVPAICAQIGIDPGASGIVGMSCGGFVSHALAVQRPQFKAMVAVISSPDWLGIDPSVTPPAAGESGKRLIESSPLTHADRYGPIPLCQLNGLADEVVAPIGAQKLHQTLIPLYRRDAMEDRLDIGLYDGVGHQMTPEMTSRTLSWLHRWL